MLDIIVAIVQVIQSVDGDLLPHERRTVQAFQMLSNAVSLWLHSHGEEREVADKLMKLGSRRHRKFIPAGVEFSRKQTGASDRPFFYFLEPRYFLNSMVSVEAKIQFLRHIASKTFDINPEDVIIRLSSMEQLNDRLYASVSSFATALPIPVLTSEKLGGLRHHRWVNDDNTPSTDITYKLDGKHAAGAWTFVCRDSVVEVSKLGRTQTFAFVYGAPEIAALYVSESILDSWQRPRAYRILESVRWCFDSGLIDPYLSLGQLSRTESSPFHTLHALVGAEAVYRMMPEATVTTAVLQTSLRHTKWAAGAMIWNTDTYTDNLWHLPEVFSMIAFLETGNCDVAPGLLNGVIALSFADSLYIDARVSLIQTYLYSF